MQIPKNTIVNADDLGLNSTINAAILRCYELGYINSSSLLTNMPSFRETVELINKNPVIENIGIHVNLAESKPVSDFNLSTYLLSNGEWNIDKTNTKIHFLDKQATIAFAKEIDAQVTKALSAWHFAYPPRFALPFTYLTLAASFIYKCGKAV